MDSLAAALTPLEGGHSGETFLAEAAGEQSVVRIYGERSAWRGPRAVEVDAALLRLVRGLLPVPEVREVRRPDPDAGLPGLLVTSLLPGTRLDLVLPGCPSELRSTIGTNLGTLLARLGQMPFLRPGMFLDGDLNVGSLPEDDLTAWVRRHLSALEEWAEQDRAALLAVAEDAQAVLDEVTRFCLVHSDFNAKNILVDPDTGEVTGLLDWEFAHAGSPYTDLGNLLRFERDPDLVAALFDRYLDLMPRGPDRATVMERARAADLWALVDLAARREANPVARQAHDLLLGLARSGDLHDGPALTL